jgi:hypothetical protein
MSDVTLSPGATRFFSTCTASIRRTFAEHIPLYICALVFGIATIAIAIFYRLTLPLEASVFFLELVPKFVVLGIALGALHRLVFLLRQGNGARPLPEIARWLSGQFLVDDRPGNVFHTLLALMPLMISFAALKNDIPQIHPFAWDHTFMQWDRIIGLGVLPWQILQPALGHPLVTAALNVVYDSWFLTMFACLFWQAFSPRGGSLRMQFLLAFAFEWFIGGNVLAAMFSSAGPCFYGHFASPDPYAAQMQYLHQANLIWPVLSVPLQNLLWQSYATGSGVVMGISAMPSMHVTSSVLMVLLGWRVNKWIGAGFTLYTALIAIGSVHLGWHYAVDSIAGILLALIFWYTAGAIVKFNAQRRAAYAG